MLKGRALTFCRRVGAITLAVALALGVSPPRVVTAAPGSPVLISPLSVTVDGNFVEFNWQRVIGAFAYDLRVWHGSPAGTRILDVRTVNDRYVGAVALAGGVAYWTVTAVGAGGVAGLPSSGTFVSARLAPQLVWPPDGVTLAHPEIAVTPQWDAVPGQGGSLSVDQDAGSSVPVYSGPPAYYTPGIWGWLVEGVAGTGGIPTAPTSLTRTFTYTWPDSVPELIAPAPGAANATDRSIRLEWDQVPGAGCAHRRHQGTGGKRA